nr:ATP-binding cassette domain-containing protein [Alphaproteobacteria bacterium]
FQRQGLFDSLPIWQNVAFRLLQDNGVSKAEARERAVEKLASVGLTADTADLYPSELSGGMQKRAGLARAIATDPEIIFLDEPTAGLDPIMSNIISELITARQSDLGATIISVVSDMAVVREIAERVAMLHEGRIVWQGTADELETTDNEYVHQFVNQLIDGPIQMPSLAG